MRKAEIILAILCLTGFILNLTGIPGGNILTILSFTFLSMFYFYLGYVVLNNIPLRAMFKKQSYAGISGLRIAGSVVAGFILSLALIGIEFKLMMWPGGSVMLFSCITGFVLLGLISLIKYLKDYNVFYRNLLIRVVVIGAFILLFVVNPKVVMDIKYRNNPELLEAIKASDADPDNEKLQQKVNEEFEKMERQETGR